MNTEKFSQCFSLFHTFLPVTNSTYLIELESYLCQANTCFIHEWIPSAKTLQDT